MLAANKNFRVKVSIDQDKHEITIDVRKPSSSGHLISERCTKLKSALDMERYLDQHDGHDIDSMVKLEVVSKLIRAPLHVFEHFVIDEGVVSLMCDHLPSEGCEVELQQLFNKWGQRVSSMTSSTDAAHSNYFSIGAGSAFTIPVESQGPAEPYAGAGGPPRSEEPYAGAGGPPRSEEPYADADGDLELELRQQSLSPAPRPAFNITRPAKPSPLGLFCHQEYGDQRLPTRLERAKQGQAKKLLKKVTGSDLEAGQWFSDHEIDNLSFYLFGLLEYSNEQIERDFSFANFSAAVGLRTFKNIALARISTNHAMHDALKEVLVALGNRLASRSEAAVLAPASEASAAGRRDSFTEPGGWESIGGANP